MSEPLVRLDDVTRRFRAAGPSFLLGPLALEVERGSWTALTGRSGSGKSTLLRLLASLDRPDSGAVWMFGREVTDATESALASLRRERIGVVHQEFAFLEHWSVWQNVASRFVPTGMPARERRERAVAALEALELGACAERSPRELSGGEQQRVAVARALVGEPELLLADEPTSNVDARTAEAIAERFAALRVRGTAIVVSTHDPGWIARADRRWELEGGRLRG